MDILSGLKSEASKLQKKLDTLKSAIEILNGKNGVGRGKRRRLSRSARARIAKAQRARWARFRAAKAKGKSYIEQAFRKANRTKSRKLRSASGNNK